MAAMEESMPVAAVPKRQSSAPGRRSEPMPWLKPGIFLGALTPLASIIWRAFDGGLSANPIAQIENELGLTALIFLVASLVCTPARRLFDWAWASRIRRELGLFAFFYAVLHVLTYAILDRFMSLAVPDMTSLDSWRALGAYIVEDIYKRPYITIGFTAFVALLPLALTSTAGMIRRLGGKRWQLLHRLIYLAAIAGVVHYWWLVKADIRHPAGYGIIVGVLLAARVYWARRTTRRLAQI